MVDTARLSTSEEVAGKYMNSTAVDQLKEVTSQTHPLTGIVAEPRAKQVILEMLDSGTPEAIIRSIFDSGYYEIVLPFEPAGTPYIAITYTNDFEEGYVHGLNSCLIQDDIFLTVPELEMTEVDRGEWEEEQAWDGFQWNSIEYFQESGELEAIPSPILYTIAEFDDLESVSGLQIYFAGCDYDSLNLSASMDEKNTEPWYQSKSNSNSGPTLRMRDWSKDFELGDSQNLDVDESVAPELDSNASTNSDSELDWIEDTQNDLFKPSLEFNGEETVGSAACA